LADIFISYKSERRSAAQHLSRILELNGFSVWFDYGLFSGLNFGVQIEREIRAAKAAIVLWCSLSRDSRWVLEEANLAQRLGTLTPAWLERVELPLGFGLADTIDLTIWDGAPRSHHLDRLLNEIARRVGRDPVPQFRGLQSYEETWRLLGAPSLASFALRAPVAQHESERLPDETRERERRAEQVAEAKRRADQEAENMLSGSDGHALGLWDLATGALISTSADTTGPIRSVAIAPDGYTALSGNDDGSVGLWGLISN
jgi:hypothetical protein